MRANLWPAILGATTMIGFIFMRMHKGQCTGAQHSNFIWCGQVWSMIIDERFGHVYAGAWIVWNPRKSHCIEFVKLFRTHQVGRFLRFTEIVFMRAILFVTCFFASRYTIDQMHYTSFCHWRESCSRYTERLTVAAGDVSCQCQRFILFSRRSALRYTSNSLF